METAEQPVVETVTMAPVTLVSLLERMKNLNSPESISYSA